jgi:hypothetical protein
MPVGHNLCVNCRVELANGRRRGLDFVAADADYNPISPSVPQNLVSALAQSHFPRAGGVGSGEMRTMTHGDAVD